MEIKANFLGTGTSQGVPVIGCNCLVCKSPNLKDKRLRSSLFIAINNCNILIDIGPDFRTQILKLNQSAIDAVLFTHQHRDHTAGLDDVRPIYYMHKKPIQLYAENIVFEALKHDFNYLFFGSNYPGKPKFNLNSISVDNFEISNIKVTPIRVMHHKLPVLGYRIGNLSYITDANYISDTEKKKLIGSEVLIINSLQKEKHISHFNLKESLALIAEIAPKRAYLTHISHGMGLHDAIQKELPKNVFLAYDTLELTL